MSHYVTGPSVVRFINVVLKGDRRLRGGQAHGLQCGYCTPGMLITAYELLTCNPDPSETEVRPASIRTPRATKPPWRRWWRSGLGSH